MTTKPGLTHYYYYYYCCYYYTVLWVCAFLSMPQMAMPNSKAVGLNLFRLTVFEQF